MQWKYIYLVIVGVLVLGVAYYGISPLFNNIVVEDAAPRAATMESENAILAVAASYQVVGTVAHPASGSVRIIESDGGSVIRYENYKTINGPDLYVYLSKDLDAEEFVNLGELRGTEGNINYTVPEGVNLSEYRYVLTWCKQFGVLFNYADFHSSTTSEMRTKQDGSTDDEESMVAKEGSSEALSLPVSEPLPVLTRTALLANGCFWCVEHDLAKVPGVIDVVSGYAGGSTNNPTYKDYGDSGHREVVRVTYDANRVSYGNLVEHIIKHGDPTDAAGSFFDRGPEYAPAIYYGNDEEREEALRVIEAVNQAKVFEAPLPLALVPLSAFYPAEEYHQDYAVKNPLRYAYYRKGSGRDAFITKHWGDTAETFSYSNMQIRPATATTTSKEGSWSEYVKPSAKVLGMRLTALQYDVTQEDGTERPFDNPYDKLYDEGIYVDIVSGEPLYSSKDKYDSGTGWPSFVKPLFEGAVVLKEDNGLFTQRTEVRSRYADSHLGHVFEDGPKDRGGLRYCMNSAAMRFIPKAGMEQEGYGYLLSIFNTSS